MENSLWIPRYGNTCNAITPQQSNFQRKSLFINHVPFKLKSSVPLFQNWVAQSSRTMITIGQMDTHALPEKNAVIDPYC